MTQQLQLPVLDRLLRLSLVWAPSGQALVSPSVIAARIQHLSGPLILPSSFRVLASSRHRTNLQPRGHRGLAYDQGSEASWH